MKESFNLPRSELENLIDEWILHERTRAILKRRLLDGICYEPLAEEFGMSVQRIKSVVTDGIARLSVHLAYPVEKTDENKTKPA